jgi:hypothetical protein
VPVSHVEHKQRHKKERAVGSAAARLKVPLSCTEQSRDKQEGGQNNCLFVGQPQRCRSRTGQKRTQGGVEQVTARGSAGQPHRT